MTINIADNSPRVSYSVAQGVTQTSFTVSFEFFDNDDLNVYVDGVLKTLTTDYTVTGGDGSTGTVTISVTGASGGSTVVITRDIDLERTTDFPASGAFNIATLNTELDRIIAITADLNDLASRAITPTDYDPTVSYTLPVVDDRKGRVLGFNSITGAVEAGPSIADTESLANVSADIALLADIQDGTIATNAITTVSSINSEVSTLGAISTDITTVSGISANVTTVSGISANVTTVASVSSEVATLAPISTDITTVSSNNTNVTTVATNINAVNTVASNISNINTVANDLLEVVSEIETVANDLNEATSEIEVVANNIANVNTVGTISGNVTTVAGISSDVTAVAADASDIGVVATNIVNVNAVGGISGNVTTVAGISSDVTTVAGISANVTAVANDTANIGTIATDLNGSDNIGTVAGISADVTSVASISSEVTTVADNLSDITSFFAVYRTGTSEPSTSLDTGDLFYNTSTGTLKIYNGTGWEAGVTAGSGFLPTTGGGLTGDLSFGDGVKTTFGAGSDLQIYHDSVTNNSYIAETGIGDLVLQGANIRLQNTSGSYYMRAYNNGAVNLYHNNAAKLATTSTGIDVTGTVNLTGSVDFGDWTITESGGSLYFATGGVNKMKLDASGNLDVVGNVNTNATIS